MIVGLRRNDRLTRKHGKHRSTSNTHAGGCMRALVLLLAWTMVPAALAGSLADVEIYDRTRGSVLPIHHHRGRLYIVGEPGHRYEIRILNDSQDRILAVTSVDGVNVISGETASEQQNGYVLTAEQNVAIEGWRKNLRDVATFYFTSLGDSYAARTGRPNNVGVIGVALFRERKRCCSQLEAAEDFIAAPSVAQERQGNGARAESKLGTGHGSREQSAAQYVDFERASPIPDETLVIHYDSRRNLVAAGVLPRGRPGYPHRGPKAFPHGFVPDPGE
jgi:hypothetical protein